jgi:SAM-dependent methyltransferase
MSNPFLDAHLAAGYAAARPPVHPRVVDLLGQWLGGRRIDVAADLGCGAGLSTRPLLGLARTCVAFDPAESMVRTARSVVPDASVMVAAAEAMPLATRSIDLITAAGSLNFARDLDAVWPEAARVLTRDGSLAVYDFSAARSFEDEETPVLGAWFEGFLVRYPRPVSQAIPLSPAILATRARGFRVERGQEFELSLELTPEFYVRYLLTETNVQAAVRRGTPVEDIHSWLTTTLRPVFGGRPRSVVFRGYLAWLRPLTE